MHLCNKISLFLTRNWLVEMCVLIVWWIVHLQMKRGKDEQQPVGEAHEMQGMLSSGDRDVPENAV
jgi:hypothetical protein